MKTLLLIIYSLLISSIINAQSALTVTSENENIRFTLLIDGVQMTDFFETYIKVSNLPKGYHEVKVFFEEDSVADYFKNILLKDKFEKKFLVEKKTDFKKDVNQSGRDVGKKMKIGVHDETFDYLVDKYQLKYQGKERFTPTDSSQYTVSTELSKSTSILPVSKQ